MSLLSRPFLRVATAALALAVIGLSGPAAHAERLGVADPRGDMTKVDEGGTDPRPAPAATNGDIVRSTFRHTDHRVVVRVRFADLRPTGKRLNLWVDLRDESGRLRTLGVEATRRDRDGHVILMTRRGVDVPCRVAHRIDYRANVVRASVPRRCLGTPRTVEFRVLSEHVRRSWAYAYLDNGLSTNLDDRSWTAPLRRG
jgi:hypothetical protein